MILILLVFLGQVSSAHALATVMGTILDASNNTPCAGAWVYVDGNNNSTYTNSMGFYLLTDIPLGEGGHSIYVTKSAYAMTGEPDLQQVADGMVATVNANIYIGSLVTGKVTDYTNGAAIANAQLSGNIINKPIAATQTLSQADGTYAIRMPPGEIAINATAVNHAGSNYNRFLTFDKVDVPNMDFPLYRGGAISGTVTADGLPVAYASVSATVSTQYIPRAMTFTAGDGFYLIPNVYPTLVDVTVIKEGLATGYRNHVQVIDLQTTTQIDLNLEEGANLQGEILDYEGLPVNEARVTAFPNNGNTAQERESGTDSSGHYCFTGLRGGEYSLQVVPEVNYNTRWLQPEEITGIRLIPPGTLTRNFTLQKGGRIEGIIRGYDQTLMANAGLRIQIDFQYPWAKLYETKTNSSGYYQFRGLSPSHSYALSISPPSDQIFYGEAAKRGIIVAENQTQTENFLLPHGGGMQGFVRDVNAQPVTIGMAIVFNASLGIGRNFQGVQGAYVLASVPEGDFTFIIMPTQGNYQEASSYLHVTPGVMVTQDVQLLAGGVLEGKVTDSGGMPLANVKIMAQNKFHLLTSIPNFSKETFTDNSGYYRLEGLSNGNYEAEAQSDTTENTGTAFLHLTTFQVSSGSVIPYDFVLPAQGTKVYGSVRDQYGNRLPGCFVYFWCPGSSQRQGTAKTDTWGNYAMMLPSGTYSAQAFFTSMLGTNLATEPLSTVTVSANQPLYKEFIMLSGGTIKGTCTNALGQPMALALVTVFQSDSPLPARIAFTDNQGHYEVPGLHTGVFQIQVAKTGYTTNQQNIAVNLGNDVQGLQSTLVEQTSIAGNVQGKGGLALKGAMVQALSSNGDLVVQTTTNQTGDYILSPLTGGPFQVKASSIGQKSALQSGIYPGGRADFTLEPLISHDEAVTYPNPCRGSSLTFLYWLDDDATVLIRVYNQAGELVWDWEGPGMGRKYNKQEWQVAGVAPGVYIYKISLRNEDGGKKSFPGGKLTIIK